MVRDRPSFDPTQYDVRTQRSRQMGTQLRLVLTRVVLPVLVICTVVVLAVVREPRSVAEQPASEAPPLEVPEWGKVTVKTVCLEIRL